MKNGSPERPKNELRAWPKNLPNEATIRASLEGENTSYSVRAALKK